jgi:hypothetical protein
VLSKRIISSRAAPRPAPASSPRRFFLSSSPSSSKLWTSRGATGEGFGSPVPMPLDLQRKTLASPRLLEPAPMAGPREWHRIPHHFATDVLLAENRLTATLLTGRVSTVCCWWRRASKVSGKPLDLKHLHVRLQRFGAAFRLFAGIRFCAAFRLCLSLRPCTACRSRRVFGS